MIDNYENRRKEQVKTYVQQFFPEAKDFLFITQDYFFFTCKGYRNAISMSYECLWSGKCFSFDEKFSCETKQHHKGITSCLEELRECLDHMAQYFLQEY